MKLLKLFDYKVSTLEVVNNTFDVQTVVLIFKKSGILLQRIIFGLEVCDDGNICEETLLLELLKSFCPNITYLNMNAEFSVQLLKLIGNLQNLQFLSLCCYTYDKPKEVLKIRVMQFSEILPLLLQYLDLENDWLEQYLDIFLNYCNTPFKKLLPGCLNYEKNVKALIEFCIRNRTLNYMGLYSYSELDDNIRKEVEAYVALVPYEDIVVDF